MTGLCLCQAAFLNQGEQRTTYFIVADYRALVQLLVCTILHRILQSYTRNL